MEKVIIFSAPSGSGKTTLVKHCLTEIPQLAFSISATTRQPRGEEINGKDYYFLSVTDFKEQIERDNFVEYEEVYPDKFYGTLKSEVERIWQLGKAVIFDVDVKGGVNLKKIFGPKALAVFIAPPSIAELEKRLIGRATDDLQTIQTRVQKSQEEMSYQDQFDKTVVNDDLEIAKMETEILIKAFLSK